MKPLKRNKLKRENSETELQTNDGFREDPQDYNNNHP